MCLGLAPLLDIDLWFHLATGRLIAGTGSVPHADVFSFTAAGQPWVTHEWLWELAAWGLWSRLGPGGISVLKAGTLAVGAGFAFLLARRLTSDLAAVFAVLLACLAACPRFVERPQTVTWACFLAVLWLAELHRAGKPWPLRLAVFPLFLFWANVHAGVLYGLCLLGYQACWALLRRQFRRSAELFGLAGLGLGASLLTPSGPSGLLYPFTLLRLNENLNLSELRPVWELLEHFSVLLAVLALSLAAVVALFRLRKAPESSVLFLVLFAAALKHERGVDLAAAAAVPLWAALAHGDGRPNARGRAALCIALAATAFAALLQLEPWRRPSPGAVYDEGMPAGAVAWLDRSGIQGRGYNSQPLGSYLLFADPRRQVFIDGRNDPFLAILDRMAAGEDLFRAYDLTYAIATHDDLQLSLARKHLQLAYFDDAAQVLVRSPSLPLYRCLLPEGPFFAAGADLGLCAEEAARAAAEAPRSYRAWVLVAAAATLQGDAAGREVALQRAAEAPHSPVPPLLAREADLAAAFARPGGLVELRGRLAGQPLAASKRLHLLADVEARVPGACDRWRAFSESSVPIRAWDSDPRSPLVSLLAQKCP